MALDSRCAFRTDRDRRGRARRGSARARTLAREKPGATGWRCTGTVRQVFYLGATREFRTVELDGGERGFVETPNDGQRAPFEPGDAVWLAASFDDCRVLPARCRLRR